MDLFPEDYEATDPARQISLCETLDRVLNKGVVVAGEVTISVANIDLVYVGLHLLLTSVETAHRLRSDPPGLRPALAGGIG